MAVTQYIFIAIGLFSIAGAIFNWDWFMDDYKTRFLRKLLGRHGARIVYALLGLFLICLAIFWL